MKNPWEWDEADLQRLIDDQVPEGLHLDYKRSESLQKIDKRREELSKDVAAFANSDGGTLVYGIAENPKTHLPEQIDSGCDPSEINKDWIEQVINGNIQRRVTGIKIGVVPLTHSPGRVAYVVHVPQSLDAPHMAKDHRYYKRYNFEILPMEDYEVRDVSRRFRSPTFQLRVDLYVKFQAFSSPDQTAAQASCTCNVYLTVEGNATARDLFVSIQTDPPFNLPYVGPATPDWRATGTTRDRIYGFAANRPIHPGEVVQILGQGELVNPLVASRLGLTYTLPSLPVSFKFKVYSQDQPFRSATIDFSNSEMIGRHTDKQILSFSEKAHAVE